MSDQPSESGGAHEERREDIASQESGGAVSGYDEAPDVLLDVPTLKVDEISLEVADLRAQVSLRADVLDLLRLSVGADVGLGRVTLTIKGVEADVLLKVRLVNVARIIDRVMTTIDANPQILQSLVERVGAAVEEVGGGAGRAVEEVGGGAGRAVEDVGGGAGRAVEDVGGGAGRAVEDVGGGTGETVKDVGRQAGETLEGEGTGGPAEPSGTAAPGAGRRRRESGEPSRPSGEETSGGPRGTRPRRPPPSRQSERPRPEGG